MKSYHYTGSIDAIIKIIKQEGVLGLYRGNHRKYLGFGATLGFFGPYSALYFASFEYLKGIIYFNKRENILKLFP